MFLYFYWTTFTLYKISTKNMMISNISKSCVDELALPSISAKPQTRKDEKTFKASNQVKFHVILFRY